MEEISQYEGTEADYIWMLRDVKERPDNTDINKVY